MARKREDYIANLMGQIKEIYSDLKVKGVSPSGITFKEEPRSNTKIDKNWAKKYDAARLYLKRSGDNLGKIKIVCHSIDQMDLQ